MCVESQFSLEKILEKHRSYLNKKLLVAYNRSDPGLFINFLLYARTFLIYFDIALYFKIKRKNPKKPLPQEEKKGKKDKKNFDVGTLGTRGNSLAKSGRPKAGETIVRSEVSEASEGPNASSLWWRTPMVSLC